MATPRDQPFVWVTWLSAILSGATTCEWSVWFKAHNTFAKRPRDRDLAKYQIEHRALMVQVRDRFRSDGYVVYTERQNEFKLRGSVGVLAGRPDLVAVKGKTAWVIDVKTLSMSVSHRVQVMLYMWALPKAFPTYHGLRSDGRLVCPTGELDIPADEIDERFVRRTRELLHQVCGDEPPMTSPSRGECQYCEITAEDCPDRMESAGALEAETDEF